MSLTIKLIDCRELSFHGSHRASLAQRPAHAMQNDSPFNDRKLNRSSLQQANYALQHWLSLAIFPAAKLVVKDPFFAKLVCFSHYSHSPATEVLTPCCPLIFGNPGSHIPRRGVSTAWSRIQFYLPGLHKAPGAPNVMPYVPVVTVMFVRSTWWLKRWQWHCIFDFDLSRTVLQFIS